MPNPQGPQVLRLVWLSIHLNPYKCVHNFSTQGPRGLKESIYQVVVFWSSISDSESIYSCQIPAIACFLVHLKRKAAATLFTHGYVISFR